MGIKSVPCNLGAEEKYIPSLQGKVSHASTEEGVVCALLVKNTLLFLAC